MKFYINKIPDDASFNPDNEWNPIKEPSNLWLVQLLAIPFAILNILIVILAAAIIGVQLEFKSMLVLAGFVMIIPIHELLHALVFPDKLTSDRVSFGVFPSKLMFFAFYLDEMSRNRFLLTLLMPYLSISTIGFILLAALGRSALIESIILSNALASCGDMMGAFLILFQVPRNAIIRNKGIRTYWRLNQQ